MRFFFHFALALFLLTSCGPSVEDLKDRIAYIEKHGFRNYEAVLASEPRNAQGLGKEAVWFQFRRINSGKPGAINKWPAVAPAGKFNRGDRVMVAAFVGQGGVIVTERINTEGE
ncbi:MAG: hypothetical protein COU11_04520 [Candidatus Harrisonbacteria bacterium CG10_big_fil_rev_8_21_14_0_10_49_15]|uniref:Uncharacterized protein n=1 Tax=Candidatus Harrisonbacteria bacterium CG10_big_fil_rev_8_21_14_0_10_49_15 TaxID=1974587 RepID=A0A2H0UK15_9BACT|nr:MAG: hypothetical protein COU11_04520 [Candidatus Harrisonbacteria bacterium CG10_big_fil_rev_8_21_14_0_10_49_15]